MHFAALIGIFISLRCRAIARKSWWFRDLGRSLIRQGLETSLGADVRAHPFSIWGRFAPRGCSIPSWDGSRCFFDALVRSEDVSSGLSNGRFRVAKTSSSISWLLNCRTLLSFDQEPTTRGLSLSGIHFRKFLGKTRTKVPTLTQSRSQLPNHSRTEWSISNLARIGVVILG